MQAGGVDMVNQEQSGMNLRHLIKSIFSGLKYSFYLIFITILLLVLTYLMGWDWSKYEQSIYEYAIYTAIGLGALAAGYKSKTKGWMVGSLLALSVWLIFFIIGRIWGIEQNINAGMINGLIGIIIGAVVGIIGINL
jgi:putative membrane protein (TIGR04086 family)